MSVLRLFLISACLVVSSDAPANDADPDAKAVTNSGAQVPDGTPEHKGAGEPMMVTSVFQEKSIQFTSGEISGEEIRYRLMPPPNVETGKTYPLVVFLHGAGERGTDNALQLKYLPEQMAQPEWREKYPCYLLAPQCRPDKQWVEVDWTLPETHDMSSEPGDMMKFVMQVMDRTINEQPIDKTRIYVTGLSMGGYGTWELAIRRPELFAAAAVVCGGVDNSKVGVLKKLPLWVAHGDADNVVPVQRSRLPVEFLRQDGAKPVYVEYPGVGHNSWTPAYSDNDGLVPWLFRQRRK